MLTYSSYMLLKITFLNLWKKNKLISEEEKIYVHTANQNRDGFTSCGLLDMNDVEGIFTNITCLIEGSGGSKCKRQKWSYFMLANRHVFTVIHSKPRGTTTRNPTHPHPNKGPETKVIRSNVSIFFLLCN